MFRPPSPRASLDPRHLRPHYGGRDPNGPSADVHVDGPLWVWLGPPGFVPSGGSGPRSEAVVAIELSARRTLDSVAPGLQNGL